MKINDQHLCAFAMGNAAVDKQGYLMKRGEVNRSFQRRWFVLKGNLLFYYEKDGDREPVGVVILESCSVKISEADDDVYGFELSFSIPNSRVYVFGATSQEEMEEWMQALTYASYDFMKKTVADLQAQLDSLNASDVSKPIITGTQPTSTLTSRAAAAAQAHVLSTFESFPEFDARLSGGSDVRGREGGVAGGGLLVDLGGMGEADGARVGKVRSFEVMHEEFGREIKNKLRLSQQSNPASS